MTARPRAQHRLKMRDADGFCEISDYGFLSDCRSAALVARDGAIDWLCWPRFDSPAIFAALLDSECGGSFVIRPTDPYEVRREYVAQTNVLCTTFTTAGGQLRLTDWLHTGARQALCRLVECCSGEVSLEMTCDPRPGYGADGPVAWTERLGWLLCDLPGDCGDRLVLDGMEAAHEQLTLRSGQQRFVTLGLDRPGPSESGIALHRAVERWRDWAEDLTLPRVAPEAVRRSALVLKGLQYEPSGAIVAAATTSLPEQLGGERNWDYRFSWLRDASFTLYSLRLVGRFGEAHSWLDWLKMISLVSGGRDLQIMYGVGGEAELPEHTLDHLRGYRDSRPVRIGNGAAKQRQIDTYGEVIDAIWLQRTSSRQPISKHRWRFVRALAMRAMAEWDQPDEGIWEVRGAPQHFVYSKVMCWVALDRAIKIARADRRTDAPVADWRSERDAIRKQILAKGYDDQLGAFTQAYESGTLDASNLMLAQVGFISARDPRFVGTVRATQQQLTRGGLVYRYLADDTDDGLAGDEGTFALCSLWLVLALCQIGDVAEASRVFYQVLDCANDLGLLSEELTTDGRQLGNFPQAFTHIAVIAAAFALQRAADRAAV